MPMFFYFKGKSKFFFEVIQFYPRFIQDFFDIFLQLFFTFYEQLNSYLLQQKKSPYKIRWIETSEIIGHCELNFENELPRLSRILIGEKNLRNKGIGTLVMHQLINLLFKTTTHTAVDLSVFDWNLNAIACYKKIGFTIRPELKSSMIVSRKNWNAFNMILRRDDYYAINEQSATA